MQVFGQSNVSGHCKWKLNFCGRKIQSEWTHCGCTFCCQMCNQTTVNANNKILSLLTLPSFWALQACSGLTQKTWLKCLITFSHDYVTFYNSNKTFDDLYEPRFQTFLICIICVQKSIFSCQNFWYLCWLEENIFHSFWNQYRRECDWPVWYTFPTKLWIYMISRFNFWLQAFRSAHTSF